MALIYHNDIDPSSLVDMEGDVKLTETKDPRGRNTSDFWIAKEDHTIANLLRMKLHTNRSVKFAGYRVPHPTKHDFVLKVQTSAPPGSQAVVPTPSAALLQALDEVRSDVTTFERSFAEALNRFGSAADR